MSRRQPHRGCGSAERFYRPPMDDDQRYSGAHIEANKELAYLCETLINTKVDKWVRVMLVCVYLDGCGSIGKMDYALNRLLRGRRLTIKVEEQYARFEQAKTKLWEVYLNWKNFDS